MREFRGRAVARVALSKGWSARSKHLVLHTLGSSNRPTRALTLGALCGGGRLPLPMPWRLDPSSRLGVEGDPAAKLCPLLERGMACADMDLWIPLPRPAAWALVWVWVDAARSSAEALRGGGMGRGGAGDDSGAMTSRGCCVPSLHQVELASPKRCSR